MSMHRFSIRHTFTACSQHPSRVCFGLSRFTLALHTHTALRFRAFEQERLASMYERSGTFGPANKVGRAIVETGLDLRPFYAHYFNCTQWSNPYARFYGRDGISACHGHQRQWLMSILARLTIFHTSVDLASGFSFSSPVGTV